MDNVKRILDFIDTMSDTVAPNGCVSETKAEQPVEHTVAKEAPKEPEPKETTAEQPVEQTNQLTTQDVYTLDTIHENDKGYKSFRNRLNKVNTYPKTIKVYGEEYITIRTPEELATIKQTITNNKKLMNKQLRNDRLKNTQLYLDQLPDLEEDETTYRSDNYIYKQPLPIGVVDGEDKPKRLPRTSKKDRERIFADISTNKENLKQLVTNKEDFETLTEKFIGDDVKPVYMLHKNNDILPDDTWTYDNFINTIDRMRTESLHKPKRTTRQQPINADNTETSTVYNGFRNYGLNPLLLQRRG